MSVVEDTSTDHQEGVMETTQKKAHKSVKPETFQEEIKEVCRLARGGAWVRSSEMVDAIEDIKDLVYDDKFNCRVTLWDVINGIKLTGEEDGSSAADDFAGPGGAEPALAAIQLFRQDIERRLKKDPAELSAEGFHILVLRNGHREVVNNSQTDRQTLTAMQLAIEEAKVANCLLIIMAHSSAQVPPELNEMLWRVDHDLPNMEERSRVVEQIGVGGNVRRPTPEEVHTVAKLTGGLTRGQLEGVVSLSYVRHREISFNEISHQKAKIINEGGLLRLHEPEGGFDTLGGLDGVKRFLSQAMRPDRPEDTMARGVLLLGVPGVGKSQLAKALGAEINRPTLSMDIGALMGGIVGETEERTRQALSIADSVAPAVLYVDEIEKALGGMASGGDHDSGVGSRLFGSLLTWLNDHTSDIFFIATANDVSRLPKEFLRAGRFDGLFFIDQPTEESREVIWDLYLSQFKINADEKRPDDTNWTGAEIKSCCRLSRLLDVPLVEAARQVVPVSVTAAEQINELRLWANKRCTDADTGETYIAAKAANRTKKTTKKVAKKKPTPRKRGHVE